MRMLANQEIEQIAQKITVGLEKPTRGWSLLEAATACIYWCIVHKGWRDGTDLGITKKAAKEQLHDGPLSNRPIGAIEPKVMNVTSAAQKLLSSGTQIFHSGRYKKRNTGEDLGPMVCKGFAPADNYQDILNFILPKALEHFGLVERKTESSKLYFIDPAHDEVRESDHHEGQKVRYLGIRYERDHKARKACLDHWGFSCQVCDMNFSHVYGEIGDRFIHVHHLNPISETGNTITDPVSDLRPVCPNCHSMLHQKNPPFGIAELKELMKTI
jgi:hypothetical protein